MDDEDIEDRLISERDYHALCELEAELGMGMTTADVLDALALLTRVLRRIGDIENDLEFNLEELR